MTKKVCEMWKSILADQSQSFQETYSAQKASSRPSCAFVLAGVVPKSTVLFWEEGGFLTFGKVNGAKIDRFFRVVLDIREGQLSMGGGRCQNRPLFRGGGGVQI